MLIHPRPGRLITVDAEDADDLQRQRAAPDLPHIPQAARCDRDAVPDRKAVALGKLLRDKHLIPVPLHDVAPLRQFKRAGAELAVQCGFRISIDIRLKLRHILAFVDKRVAPCTPFGITERARDQRRILHPDYMPHICIIGADPVHLADDLRNDIVVQPRADIVFLCIAVRIFDVLILRRVVFDIGRHPHHKAGPQFLLDPARHRADAVPHGQPYRKAERDHKQQYQQQDRAPVLPAQI